MQTCPKCNAPVEGDANYCSSCGNQIKPGQTVYAAPGYTAPASTAKTPSSSHPVLNVVKRLASSQLFLVAVIAYSAQILFAIVNSAGTGAKVEILLYQLLDSLGGNVPYEAYKFVDSLSRIGDIPFVIGTFLGLIPSIIICAGLWMTYASAKNRLVDGMSTAGLTMIKVITVIQIIFTCLALAGVELILLLAVIGIALTTYAPGAAIGVMVMLVLFVTAAYTLQIIYLVKIIKSINAAKKTIITGVPVAKASTFVAIWSFVVAFCAIFGLVSDFVGSVATITFLICFGILVYKYNRSMKTVAHPVQTEIPVNIQ